MPDPQTYKNHARYDPFWHFFLMPFSFLNLLFAIATTVYHWPSHRVLFSWFVLVSFAFVVAVVKTRTNPLRTQDRIIRLEERLRFHALLPPDLLARSHSLSTQQIVALRFAPDDELPELVRRALDENLSAKQIKQTINRWRPDYLRV